MVSLKSSVNAIGLPLCPISLVVVLPPSECRCDVRLLRLFRTAADYLSFKHIHEELARVFANETGKHFGLYGVEHVFLFKGGNPSGGNKPVAVFGSAHVGTEKTPATPTESTNRGAPEVMTRLPESYVPPIVAVLPRMARNETAAPP